MKKQLGLLKDKATSLENLKKVYYELDKSTGVTSNQAKQIGELLGGHLKKLGVKGAEVIVSLH